MSIIADIKQHIKRTDSAIMLIVYLCLGGFVLGNLVNFIVGDSWHPYFYLSSKIGNFVFKPWSIFTYFILHLSLWHLISNMAWLWFIGDIYKSVAGNKRVWITFIGGGIAGGILYLLAYNLLPNLLSQANHLMIGASAGVTAIVVAAAVLLPKYEINLLGSFRIKLVWIALFRVLTDISVLGKTNNDGGHIAHLGGAIFGFLFVYYFYNHSFNIISPKETRKKKKQMGKKDPKFKVEINEPKTSIINNNNPNQEQIDAVLEKISLSGYTSLSQSEKDILFKASKK